MRKALVIMVLVLAVAGCEQKEKQSPQSQIPGGPIQTGPVKALDEEKLLRDVLAKDPNNLEALISLGNLLMDTKRYAEAADVYHKALDIDPRNVDVRVDMGTCMRYAGNPEGAVKEYRKALELNPGHVNAHMNLGVVLSRDYKDYAGAIRELEKAVSLAPNSPDAPRIRQEIERLRAQR